MSLLISYALPLVFALFSIQYSYASANTNTVIYTWNKTALSALDYQQSICPYNCNKSHSVTAKEIEDKCARLKCIKCSCVWPQCELYGVCCPGVLESYHPQHLTEREFVQNKYRNSRASISDEPLEPNNSMNVFNVTSSFENGNIPNVECSGFDPELNKSYLVLSSCPVSFIGNIETVRLCEMNVPDSNMTFDLYAEAVDTVNDVIYKNVYCAQCNGADKVTTIQLDQRITCIHFMELYSQTSRDMMLRAALTSDTCKVFSLHPTNVTRFLCEDYLFRGPIIESCRSASSEWKYDAEVANACQNVKNLSFLVDTINMKTFGNIFCSICHRNAYPEYQDCEQIIEIITKVPPLSLLLNFRDRTNVISTKTLRNQNNCTDIEWGSFGGKCVPLLCAPGKYLHNGLCSTMLTNIRGLFYRLRILLVPQKYALIEDLKTVEIFLSRKLGSDPKLTHWYKFSISSLTTNLMTRKVDDDPKILNVVALWIDCVILAGIGYPRDSFEAKIIDLFFVENFKLFISGSGDMKFRPLFVFDEISTVVHHSDERYPLRINVEFEATPITSSSITETKKIYVKTILDSFMNKTSVNYLLINITKLLTCSFVEFNETDYSVYIFSGSLHIQVSLDLNGTKLNISDFKDLNKMVINGDGLLCVCKDLLDGKLNTKHSSLPSSPKSVYVQYILTLLCLGASILCLVLTLATYFLFPVMRTDPGKNTMFLCLSLILAQISLIASSNIPSPGVICKVVGVSTHLTWLWMFSWSFICSFNMVRVFISKTRNSVIARHEVRRNLIKRFVVSLLMPVVVVLAVVVTTLFWTDGNDIGYGQNLCYLDTPLIVGLAVLGPMTFIVSLNVVFLTLTVVNIERIRHLQRNVTSSDTRNLLVYVKLSSLTGAFWTMAMVGEVTDLDFVRFLSIFLNGLQGVFIFLSFICNKKIMTLYAMSLIKSDVESTGVV